MTLGAPDAQHCGIVDVLCQILLSATIQQWMIEDADLVPVNLPGNLPVNLDVTP